MKGEAKESDAQPAALAMKAAEGRGDAKQKDMEEETKRKDEAATKVREDKESDPQAAASDPQAREAKESDPQAAAQDLCGLLVGRSDQNGYPKRSHHALSRDFGLV